MKTRTTIALGALFFAMVFVYAYTNVEKIRERRAAWQAKRIFSFEPADVTTLSITQRDGAPVEAVREADGTWRFSGANASVEPNGPLWEQIALAVAAVTNERPIADVAPDPAEFELDVPRLTVEVGTKTGVLSQLNFGGLDPTQRHRYTQLGNGAVFLTRAELFSALDRPLLDLRDRRLFTNLGDGVTRVDYERLPAGDAKDVELEESVRQAATAIHETYTKTEAGEWRMTAPVDARARQDRLRLIEATLPQLDGREFIDEPENLADYRLATPFSRLTAYGKDGTPQTLLLGALSGDKENAGLYVKRADRRSIAIVDARFLNILPNEPEALREKRLFTGEAKSLQHVQYHDTAGEFALENSTEKGWRLVGPGAEDTDQAAVSLYLATLKMIEGDSFPEGDASAIFGTPRITLDFDFGAEHPATKIEIGGPVAGADPIRMYARQDFGPVTTISFEKYQAIEVNAFDFRVKTLFAFDPGLTEEVEMAIDGTRYRFAQANGRWSVVEPAGRRLEAQADLTVFLETVAKTIVRGIADPAPAAEVSSVDTPTLELVMKIAGPNPHVLGPIRVGNLKAASARERFVTISGRDGVYYVDQSLVDAARQCAASLRGQ